MTTFEVTQTSDSNLDLGAWSCFLCMDTHPAIHHEGAPDRDISGGEGLRGVAFAARVRRRWAAFKTAAKAAESITKIGNLATANPFEMATHDVTYMTLLLTIPSQKDF